MNARFFAAAAAVLLSLAGLRASAQQVNLANAGVERPNLFVARTGLDHGFVGELGYFRVVELAGRRVFLGGELQLPWASPDLGDYRARASAAMVLFGERDSRWQLATSLSPTVRSADTALARMTSVGVDARLTGGFYLPGGFVAAEVGVDWAAATHIANSEAYRKNVYAGAEDGWYRNTGGTTYAALMGGLSLGKVDLVLRAGVPRGIDLGTQNIPFFTTLGMNVAFQ